MPWKKSLLGNNTFAFAASILLMLTFSVMSIYLLDRSFNESEWIEHRRLIETEIDGIIGSIHEMEATQRGYILTKDSSVATTYHSAELALFAHIDSAQNLTKDDDVHYTLDSIRDLIGERVELMVDIDSIFTSSGQLTTQIEDKVVDGDQLMDEIRSLTEILLNQQKDLLESRVSSLTIKRGAVFGSILLFAILSMLVTILGYSRLLNDQKALIKANEDKKRYLEELNESESRYRSLNENSNDAIVISDQQGVILSWNASAERIFGYTSAEAVGLPLDIIIPEHYGDKHLKAIKNVLDTGETTMMGKRVELEGKHKDGTLRPIELTIAEWKTEGRHFFSGNMRDISEEKEIKKKLDQTMRELKRSNAELEQFAYVASHDLQEPLRKIRAFGDRLVSKIDDPAKNKESLVEYTSRMANAAERMQNLIQDLLSFSRVTRNLGDRESVDMNITMEEILGDLELFINDRNGEVVFGKLPVVENVSRTQIHQLFQNLISNGIKFHSVKRKPKVVIEYALVKAKDIKQEGLKLTSKFYHKFEVSDNGIGFDEKYMDKVFTIFQRLHDRTEYSGSGIGLAMCKRICENHRGTIYASSQLEKGTTFTVLLPGKKEV